MKLALLVALATIATVSSYRSSVHSVVYKPGEQYVYHYKGQILNGIPKSTKQFSGLLIDSLVLLQFQQDYRVVMKLEKIKLYKVDDKVTLPPSESLPESEMIRLTGEQEQVIVEKLLLPMKFRYEEGEIRELQTETRDKYWSVNIKKGILSIFQVTLKEKHSLSSDSSIYYDPTMSRIKSYGSRSYGSSTPYWNPSTKTNSVYTVKETDVSGNCETKYTIVNDNTARGPSSSTMFITAVRNFDTCLTRPFNIEGLFQGVPTSAAERELVQPTVHTDYVITGDRTHFLIKEATRRGKYFVFVHGLEGGDLSSYVYQKLTLKSTESLRTAVHLVSPKTDNRGLQMIIPKANLLPEKETSYGRPSSRYESFMYKKKSGLEYELKKSYESEEDNLDDSEEELSNEADVVPVIERKLRELTECIYMNTAERKCSDLLMEATLIIREATKDQLKTLYERHVKPVSSGPGDIEYRLSEMLLDILPTISTPGAAEVLIELTRERRITPLRASLLISTMSLTVKPNPTVIKQLLEMFKEMNKVTTANSLTGQALLRQSTLLAVGTIVHRLLVVMRSQGKPIPQLITFVDTISTEMKRMMEESSGAEKILIVKAMGNMGASENIVVLRSIIENKSRHDLETRISAIYAMRRVAKEFKKQVIPTLMGVFMDENEDRRARQASFMVIIKANPTYPTLQMIAHRASYDKCQQTKTLVYSNLINLAYYTSHQPEHKQLIKNTRMVLKAMMPVYVGFYDSMSLFTSHFSEKYDMGVAFDVTKIKSKNSGFPETILASLETTVFGKHRRILEAGAEGKAYTALLRKLFGPHGLLSQVLKGKVSIEDVLNTFGKDNLGGVKQKIIEVMNKMRMEVPSEEDLFANWYVKLFENELQYITLNSHNIEELISNVNRWIVDKIMQLSRGTSFDVIKTGTHRASLTVATCFGVPLHLNHTIYAIAKLEGSVKVNNLPTDLGYLWNQYKRFSLPESVEQLRLSFPFNIPDIKFEMNVKPVIDVSQYVTFTSDLRWMKAGVGVEKYLRVAKPFALTGELNKPQHSISIKYFPTKETIPMLHARAVPIQFFSRIPTTVTKLPYITEVKELQNEDIMKKSQFNQMVRIPLTGQELTLTGVYSLCGPRWCPIMPFFGKQEFVIISKPTSDNIDFLELKITALKNNFEIEGIPSHLPTEELYEQYDQEYYEKESVNYRTASRRSALLTEEFDPVPVDPAFESETPIKRQMRVTLRPSTWQVPSWKGQLTWYMSRTPFLRQNIKDWINQFNTQIIRNVHENTPKWKLVMNTVINPKAWIPTSRFSDFKEYLLTSEATLNLNGDVKNMRLKITPGSPFNFEEEMMKHMMWPIHDRPESKTPIHKYTAELMFPELNQKTKRGLIVINDAIKYFLHDKMVADLPEGPFENNKLIVSMELLPEWEKMHMIVKNAHESLYIADVPFYLNPFQLTNEMVKVHNHYSWDFYKRHDLSDLSTSSLDLLPYNQYPTPLQTRGECKLDYDKETLRTFDGARYSLKHAIKRMIGGCEVVLAQDCRKEGLFSVLTSGTGNDNWVEKVYLPDTEIITKYVGNRYIVTVNGQNIDLRPSRFVSIPSDVETTSALYRIGLISEKVMLIEAKELGLTIEYDQNNYTPVYHLSHGSMLWGNICGLCGNNNQDPSDDLEMPSSLLKLSSSSSFNPSYIIPSGTCKIDTPVVDTDYCKKTTVLTVRRYENETPMTCTSEKRIVQCAEGCRPAQLRSVKTCFRCQSETGQSLARTSYYEQASVLDLEDSSLTCSEFSERVEVPTVCEPIY